MNNTPSKILRAGLFGLLVSGFVLPAASEASPFPNGKPRVSIELGGGPPSLRVETYGRAPSRRHVWVPGHWDWSRRHHDWVWRSGYWKVPPRGRGHWVAPRYERGRDGWVVIRGHWDRDRHDRHDGYDRRHDRDRDGRH